jgi:hypothetical protein
MFPKDVHVVNQSESGLQNLSQNDSVVLLVVLYISSLLSLFGIGQVQTVRAVVQKLRMAAL